MWDNTSREQQVICICDQIPGTSVPGKRLASDRPLIVAAVAWCVIEESISIGPSIGYFQALDRKVKREFPTGEEKDTHKFNRPCQIYGHSLFPDWEK